MKTCQTNARRNGFTLVEVLIGLALSSIVMLGITQLFVANSRTYNLLAGQSFMQESGRFAVKMITRSGQMAGYKGCFSKNAETHKTFLADIPYEFNIARGVIGFDGEDGGTWSPSIVAVLPQSTVADGNSGDSNIYSAGAIGPGNGIDTSMIMTGTDIITFNYIDSKKHRLKVDMVTSDEDIETEDTDYKFGTDYMAFIHDCEKATIFRVTGFDGALKIEHDATVDPDGYTNALTRLAKFYTFETDAYVSAIVSETYFIGESEGENKTGQHPMSLWRKTGVEAPVEVIEGIEDLQVSYGIDTDNDDVPNKYVDADLVVDFGKVLTLRIEIIANSVDDVNANTAPTYGCLAGGGRQYCRPGEPVDGLLRRSFSRTLVLKNRG
jgi:type IV pilus assembly protein PilW